VEARRERPHAEVRSGRGADGRPPERRTGARLAAATKEATRKRLRRADEVVEGGGEESERPVDSPTRPTRPIPHEDIRERGNRDHGEIGVGCVEPVEERDADQRSGYDVEPES